MNHKLDSFLDNLQEQLDDFKTQIDYELIEKAQKLILDSENNHGRVHVTGIGKPSYVAGYVSSLLSSTGTPAYFLHGTEAVHGSAGQIVPGDVVIAISNSGETSELQYTVNTVKNNGAKIIGVSGNRDSWLSKNSDVHLYAGVRHEGDDLNKPPRASIIMETISLQLLSLLLQESYNLDNEKYLKWHPGGALGASIRGDKK